MVFAAPLSKASRILGLTGGIGTGKTTVASYLAQHHSLPILDADLHAREAVAIGSAGLRAIVQRYGPNLLQSDGTLDRSQLAQIMFQTPVEKQWLEALIHPFVRQQMTLQRQQLVAPVMVMVIPLLFEAAMTDLVTEIWVVYCHPQQQLERLMQRNSLTTAAAQARIDSQLSLAQKCARADVILDNSGPITALYPQIDRALGLSIFPS